MGRIDWIPIEEMPDEMKDGRDLLLWGVVFAEVGEGGGDRLIAVQASWDGRWSLAAQTYYSLNIERPTHFAEINPPA